jgi:hypothetical protein
MTRQETPARHLLNSTAKKSLINPSITFKITFKPNTGNVNPRIVWTQPMNTRQGKLAPYYLSEKTRFVHIQTFFRCSPISIFPFIKRQSAGLKREFPLSSVHWLSPNNCRVYISSIWLLGTMERVFPTLRSLRCRGEDSVLPW